MLEVGQCDHSYGSKGIFQQDKHSKKGVTMLRGTGYVRANFPVSWPVYLDLTSCLGSHAENLLDLLEFSRISACFLLHRNH